MLALRQMQTAAEVAQQEAMLRVAAEAAAAQGLVAPGVGTDDDSEKDIQAGVVAAAAAAAAAEGMLNGLPESLGQPQVRRRLHLPVPCIALNCHLQGAAPLSECPPDGRMAADALSYAGAMPEPCSEQRRRTCV